MARLRFMAVALLALALAGNSTQTGRTQSATYYPSATPTKPTADDRSCTIYSLNDMGYDADLGKWIAESIPEMIEPSSWQSQGGSGALRYYAPKNILIVKQSRAIQSKVDGFLKELRTSLPKASATNSSKRPIRAGVVPVEHREPALLRTSNPVSDAQPYPVPTAVKAPKHLFHFIIRYEGDGIIDDNVVKFMKTQLQGAQSPVGVGLRSTVPCAPQAPPAVSEAPPPTSYLEPADAVPNVGSVAPYAAPAPNEGSPAPSATRTPPSPAPKKKKEKKEKKDDQKKTTVTR